MTPDAKLELVIDALENYIDILMDKRDDTAGYVYESDVKRTREVLKWALRDAIASVSKYSL